MDSDQDTFTGRQRPHTGSRHGSASVPGPTSELCHPKVGCPIRRSPDQSLLTAPRGLSQRATSFIASVRQGIHQMPFRHSRAIRTLRPCTGTDSRIGRCRTVVRACDRRICQIFTLQLADGRPLPGPPARAGRRPAPVFRITLFTMPNSWPRLPGTGSRRDREVPPADRVRRDTTGYLRIPLSTSLME